MRSIALIVCALVVVCVSAKCLKNSDVEKLLQKSLVDGHFDGSTLIDINDYKPLAGTMNLDMSMIVFDDDGVCEPAVANVLLSRDFPAGRTSHFSGKHGAVKNVDWRWWDYDRWYSTTEQGWTAPVDNTTNYFGQIVPGAKGDIFMSAHPASSFKTMLATGLLVALEEGTAHLTDVVEFNNTLSKRTSGGYRYYFKETVEEAFRQMIVYSDNAATAAIVKTLWNAGMLPNRLRELLDSLDLKTLRFDGSLPTGQWCTLGNDRSSGGDTTGWFTMTSWDAARLLWLLHPHPPATPDWKVNGRKVNANFISQKSKQYMYNLLLKQELHECLSMTLHCGYSKWVNQGIPAQIDPIYIRPDGSIRYHYLASEAGNDSIDTYDVTPCQKASQVTMAHKTGSTGTFGSNMGIVRNKPGFANRHYIISLFGNLGMSDVPKAMNDEATAAGYADDSCTAFGVCYPPQVPLLGKAVDDFMAEHPHMSKNKHDHLRDMF